jgi:hypothetical protein
MVGKSDTKPLTAFVCASISKDHVGVQLGMVTYGNSNRWALDLTPQN